MTERLKTLLTLMFSSGIGLIRMKFGKSATNKIIMGVCGGISDYFGINAAILRVILVALIIFSGSIALWIYLIVGYLMPVGYGNRWENKKQRDFEEKKRRRDEFFRDDTWDRRH